MLCINFTSGPWANQPLNTNVCDTGLNNTLTDQLTDPNVEVSFIIAIGKMLVTEVQNNRMLFFTPIDCANVDRGTTRLVIRFSRPQERISLKVNFDEHGTAPTLVTFYSVIGAPTQENQLRQLSLTASNIFNDVLFDNCCRPAQEIVITTDRPENAIDDVCWGPSLRRQVSRFGCICITERARQIVEILRGRVLQRI